MREQTGMGLGEPIYQYEVNMIVRSLRDSENKKQYQKVLAWLDDHVQGIANEDRIQIEQALDEFEVHNGMQSRYKIWSRAP